MNEQQSKMVRPLRVGIVGAGYVSGYHVRAIQSVAGTTVVGVADPSLERAKALAAKFKIPGVYASLAELGAAKPDVIHVLTPPASHCELTLQALSMGCHVFVEKPMAETADECNRMIAGARSAGRILSVNHSARFDPIVLEGLELVRQGVCGEVLAVDFIRSSDYPPYAGGPVPPAYRNAAYPFQDLGVHGLYVLEAFLGGIRTLDVKYRSSGQSRTLFFDEWRVLAECDKGTGHIYLSWTARPMQNEIVVHGTRGIVHIDCFLQTCTVRKTMPLPRFIQLVAGVMRTAASTLVHVPWNVFRFATGKLLPSPGIHAGVRAFHQALLAGVEPPVSADEGRRIVEWMDSVSREANEAKEGHFFPRPVVRPARILVTGANGFLGRALLRRLGENGDPVRVLVRRPCSEFAADPLIQEMYGDLGDPEAVNSAVRGVDVVYHVGAAMRGGKADFESGTVWGTRNIVAACLEHGIRKLVYVSSMTVLDHAGHPPGEAVTEASALELHADRRGFYTQTKLEAEKIVLDAVREQNLPAVVLRPGQIFGPGAEKTPPSGTIAVGGRWIVVGNGGLDLPLVYVDDVADALVLAAETPDVCGEVFHIVDRETITQNEYLGYCQKAAHGKLRIMRVPRTLLFAAAVAAETVGALLRRGVPLSRYRLQSARPLSPCDSSVVRRRIGWTERVGVRQGLERTFDRERAGADEQRAEAMAVRG